MKITVLIIYGLVCLLSLVINIIGFKHNKNKDKYFKFNVVGADSEKREFAVKAKDLESAINIIRETLYTKDSNKWFECSLENISL